jgi:hypothetical protein|tara:strand:+ start:737 stop:982 length:246 start_codon:yes stop_codon:yes gene_type:complete
MKGKFFHYKQPGENKKHLFLCLSEPVMQYGEYGDVCVCGILSGRESLLTANVESLYPLSHVSQITREVTKQMMIFGDCFDL